MILFLLHIAEVIDFHLPSQIVTVRMKNKSFFLFYVGLIVSLNNPQSAWAAIDQEQAAVLRKDFIATMSPFIREAFPNLRRDIRVFIDSRDKSPLAYLGPQGITLTGGLLNLSYMTEEAISFILCHEIGHAKKMGDHFIAPLKYGGGELRGDYFAAAFCLPTLLQGTREVSNVPASLITRCDSDFKRGSKEICLRVLAAGATTVEFLYREHFQGHYQRSSLPAPDFNRLWLDTADFLQCRLENIVKATFNEPPLLCRDIL